LNGRTAGLASRFDFREFLFIARGQHEPAVRRGKPPRDGGADSAAGSGDDDGFHGKITNGVMD
jgi:hypothetical protein